jgi:predicted phage-related endonuclease
MKRTYHRLIQGSAEWNQFRLARFTASEAPVMMGVSPHQSRDELLAEKATGLTAEPGTFVQKIFDDGHGYEKIAVPWAEDLIGSELFMPTISVEIEGLPLSASLDGIPMDASKVWEHKTLNKQLAIDIPNQVIAPYLAIQLESELMVSGAEIALLMASKGEFDSMVHCWYQSDPKLRSAIIAGWHQFKKDLDAYRPEPAAPVVTGTRLASLPAISISLTGSVNSSNLVEFSQSAMTLIDSIKTDLVTDQDFADAEQIIKLCDESEKALDAAKTAALGQTADIDQLFRTIDHLKESIRSKRLALNKSVKNQKETIKTEAILAGKQAVDDHVQALNDDLSVVSIPVGTVDFAGAIKGKRNLSSIKGAINDLVAATKIETDQVAALARRNIKAMNAAGPDTAALFPDLQQVAFKPSDDFQLLVNSRVTDHKERVEAAAQQQREREAAAKMPPPTPATQPPAGEPAKPPVVTRHAKPAAATSAQADNEPYEAMISDGYQYLKRFVDLFADVDEFAPICQDILIFIDDTKGAG